MIHRHTLGSIPPKHHITHYEDGKLLMEQCMTRQGFDGGYSILYYRNQPMAETKVTPHELPGFAPFRIAEGQHLRRRHVRTQDVPVGGDFLTARKTLLVAPEVHIGVAKVDRPAERFFMNGDGDELFFVTHGSGHVESVFGWQPFSKHDYILIPKGTAYRLHFADDTATLLSFEGRPYLGIPSDYRNPTGQLNMFAPFCHRDFGLPEKLLTFSEDTYGPGPYEIVVKREDGLTIHEYPHFPLDIAGWDGILYPVTFNIHDYQPKTGQVHLPPTSHVTFSGPRFVVCSFVPRKVDYYDRNGLKAVPCPYAHASVDMDEILYYVEGNFTSRKGIKEESISLHPQGITHGPHPGTYEKSVGDEWARELAVMCDTYSTLKLTEYAAGIEDQNYHLTWNE